jgi:hypothetical protein
MAAKLVPPTAEERARPMALGAQISRRLPRRASMGLRTAIIEIVATSAGNTIGSLAGRGSYAAEGSQEADGSAPPDN